MKIVIVKNKWRRQKYHFRIVAANSKILCTSETYHNLGDVLIAVDSIKLNIRDAEIVKL